MITIISGVPGSGKTALLVEMIMDELKTGRKVFTVGIPKLLLNVREGGDPHAWHEGSWLQIDRYDPDLTKKKGIKSTWFPRDCEESCPFLSTCARNNFPPPDSGALIIFDESHTDFPQRPSGKAPPAYIEALTTHRHQGLDFWFVSQKPSFLDPFVRGLSSRHIHLSINAFSFTGKRVKYQWAEYQETVNRMSKMLASKSDYKPSPAVFPLYASASVHTKLDQRMPTILKMFIIAVMFLVLMVCAVLYRVNYHVDKIKNPNMPVNNVIHVKDAASGGERSAPTLASVSSVPAVAPVLPLGFANEDFKISACLATESKCTCYTHHGIKIPMTDEECRESASSITMKFRLRQNEAPPMQPASALTQRL